MNKKRMLTAIGITTGVFLLLMTVSIAAADVNYTNRHEVETIASPYYRWTFEVFAYYSNHTTSSVTLSETSTWTTLQALDQGSTKDFFVKHQIRDGTDAIVFDPPTKQLTLAVGQSGNAAWDYNPNLVVQKYSGWVRNTNDSYSQSVGVDNDKLEAWFVTSGGSPIACYVEFIGGINLRHLDPYSQDTCP